MTRARVRARSGWSATGGPDSLETVGFNEWLLKGLTLLLATLSLFGTGLDLMGLVSWWRKRRSKEVT
jgi:hypothetical protein